MKEPTPLVACVNDLSGFGRCSLTVALPILSGMGVQACPLPTAILSAHTEYPYHSFVDFTPYMPNYCENWKKLGLRFAAVYSGFLGSADQIELVRRLFEEQPTDTLRLTDPVMADNGRLYETCDETLCAAMKRLVAAAQVVTPNITEACLLTGRRYTGEQLEESQAAALCRAVAALGPRQVVLTGVHTQQDVVSNYVYEAASGRLTMIGSPTTRRPRSYAGTGDVFASVLCGGLVRGDSLLEATARAADFVAAAVAYTAQFEARHEDGLCFEHLLACGKLNMTEKEKTS